MTDEEIDELAKRIAKHLRKFGARNFYTTAAVAKMLHVEPSKVRQWIANGELVASNIAERVTMRARWRIEQCDLDDFLRGRRAPPPKSRVRARPVNKLEYSYLDDSAEMKAINKEIQNLQREKMKFPAHSKERKAMYAQELQKKEELHAATKYRDKMAGECIRKRWG